MRFLGVALLLAGAAVVCPWWSLRIPLLLAAVAIAAVALRLRLEVTEDSLRYRVLRETHEVKLKDVKRWRLAHHHSPPTVQLRIFQEGGVEFPWVFGPVPLLRSILHGIREEPDFVLFESTTGTSEQVLKFAGGVALVVSLTALWEPASLAMPALVALACGWWHGFARQDPQAEEATRAVLYLTGWVAVMLLVFSRTYNLLDSAIDTGLVIGLVFWCVLMAVDRSLRSAIPRAAFALGLAFFYSYGAAVMFNVEKDAGPGAITRASVLRKEERRSRRQPRYFVELHDWGEQPVDEEVYAKAKVGEPLCVTVYPGALRIRWWMIDACR